MKLNEIIKSSGLPEEKQNAVYLAFDNFTNTAKEWLEKADLIVVNSENDIDSIKEANDAYKIIKKVRIDIEKTRKQLKENSLKEGKLIDSIAKQLKETVEPIEASLENKAKFVEIQKKQREDELREKRKNELSPYSEFIPFEIDYGVLSEEDYKKLLNGAILQAKQQAFQNKKAEEERIAQENYDANERNRIRIENEKLKAEKEKQELELIKAKQEAEKLQREKDEELLRKQKIEEAKRLEEERIKNASDVEKLKMFAKELQAVSLPEVNSEKAKEVLISIRFDLANIYKTIDYFEVI